MRETQLTNEIHFQIDDLQESREIPENWAEETMTSGLRDSGSGLALNETGPVQSREETMWARYVLTT